MSYPDEGDYYEYDHRERRDAVGRIPAVTLDTIEDNPDEDYPYDTDGLYDRHWSY